MQIDECLETLLGALKKPVDGPLLVGLEVVLVEVADEILAQILAEGFFDELKVLPQAGFAEGDLQEFAEAGHDVVLEPFAIQHRDDVVSVGVELSG